ncbi:unnamed protein product [Rodentolepis nana]|uniref:Peptidase_M16 domain-containing protein n=1 Tax=Rodentolepis nana TaxID=102285 RepID=A0A0R3TAB6_RODNA|nr:unnamed protein product [Rodentolepis nana]
MKSVNISKILKLPVRNAANPALKIYDEANEQTISILEREGGMKYACVPKPNMWNGLTRIMAVFNAGSRFENRPHLHGITHLIRRSCGLSTTDYTAVNLTRHVQQMGGQLHCHTTREQMIYSIDVAPNLASRAGLILATIATKTTFYDWELKDNVYKLMRKDLDMLNRRRFDALTIELLHEAAYGQHPDGTGLGNSLFANPYRIGTHKLEDIESFYNTYFTPSNAVFLVTGCGPETESVQIFDTMYDAALLRPNASPSSAPKHTFVSGERRREITGADTTYAALVWPTTGGHLSTSPDAMALTLVAAAITPPRKTIAYGSTGNFMPPSPDALAMPLNFSYSDHGLFGLLVTGSNGQVVGGHLVDSLKALNLLAQNGLNGKQFENAKARLIMEAISKSEDINQLTGDIAFQLLCASRNGERKSSDICSLVDLMTAIESVKLDDVNRILAKTVTSGKMALATVGTDVAYVPPLDALKSL